MMRGWKLGMCVMFCVCWISAACGATSADAVQKKPLTVEEMHKMNSADLLRRTDATAEEDYQAGVIATDRQELVEAQGLFERAAKKGHTGAMVKYGDLLNRAGFIDEATASYRQAAELGDPEGQFDMGMMFMDIGNYNWKKLDTVRPLEARKWLMKAAEQGYPDAVNLIAMSYAQGGLGLTDADRNNADVIKWLNKSADIGNGEAMDQLAVAYREGKFGLSKDEKLADEWAAKAQKAYGVKEKEKAKKKRKMRL